MKQEIPPSWRDVCHFVTHEMISKMCSLGNHLQHGNNFQWIFLCYAESISYAPRSWNQCLGFTFHFQIHPPESLLWASVVSGILLPWYLYMLRSYQTIPRNFNSELVPSRHGRPLYPISSKRARTMSVLLANVVSALERLWHSKCSTPICWITTHLTAHHFFPICRLQHWSQLAHVPAMMVPVSIPSQ